MKKYFNYSLLKPTESQGLFSAIFHFLFLNIMILLVCTRCDAMLRLGFCYIKLLWSRSRDSLYFILEECTIKLCNTTGEFLSKTLCKLYIKLGGCVRINRRRHYNEKMNFIIHSFRKCKEFPIMEKLR